MTSKFKRAMKDVFSGANFDRKSGLTEMFRVEYRNEYRNLTENHVDVNDRVVRNYLGL
jgi:hypothetical protein